MTDEKTDTISEEVTTIDGVETTVDTTTQTKTTETVPDTLTDEGLLFRFILFLAISVAIVVGSIIAAFWVGIRLDPEAWSTFLNAKLPLIFTQTTAALATVIAFEVLTPGSTIPTIMDLRGDNNTPENRRTACYFILGIGAIVAYTVKGGF